MLLALDTATATASLALYDRANARLLVEYTWQAARRHTQDLLASAEYVLQQLGRTPQQISALAVTTGPGSFTGVRVAISAAKGIGLGLPSQPAIVGLPTLAVTAAPWLSLAATSDIPWVCAYLQAGRGRYNWSFFAPEHLLHRPTADEHGAGDAAAFAAALAAYDVKIWLVGELDAALAAAVNNLPHVAALDAISSGRRAGQLARLAAQHLAAGTQDDLATLQPLYLQAL